MNVELDISELISEINYRTSKSSGAGGQHVNKVETRVEALIDIDASSALNEAQKQRIHHRLKNRINSEGVLIISCSETRSQSRNRNIATERLVELVQLALEKKKIRKKSGIPYSVKKKRLDKKKKQSERKSRRGFKPDSLL